MSNVADLYPQEVVLLNNDPSKFKNYSKDFSKSISTPLLPKTVDQRIAKLLKVKGIRMTPNFLELVKTQSPQLYEEAKKLPVMTDTDYKAFVPGMGIKDSFYKQAKSSKIEELNPSRMPVVKKDDVQEKILLQEQLELKARGDEALRIENEKIKGSMVLVDPTKFPGVYRDPKDLIGEFLNDSSSEESLAPKVLQVDEGFEIRTKKTPSRKPEPFAETFPVIGPKDVNDKDVTFKTHSTIRPREDTLSVGDTISTNGMEGMAGLFETGSGMSSNDISSGMGSYAPSGLASESINLDDPIDNQQGAGATPEQPAVQEVPFAVDPPKPITTVKYNKNQILFYFGSVENPDWDKELEKNIFESKISEDDAARMIDGVIKNFPELYIEKRQSKSLDELNEVLQLQFCIQRNLQRGTRSKTATIPISSLVNFANKLAGNNNNMQTSTTLEENPFMEAGDPLVNTSQQVATEPQVLSKQVQLPRSRTEAFDQIVEAYRNKETDEYGKPVIIYEKTLDNGIKYKLSSSKKPCKKLNGY